MTFFKVLLAVVCVLANIFENSAMCNESQSVWAVIHSGINWYSYSYGMEAAGYYLYQILVQNGVPKNQIIVINYDSAAYSPNNPLPGTMVFDTLENPGEPSLQNVYEDVVVDYKSGDLTPYQFYELLKGNETAVLNVTGTKKVLKSGPKDSVIFFSSTLGGYGGILFNHDNAIWAQEYIPLFEDMKVNKHFAKMYIFLDAFYGGSSFDEYMDTDKNIIAHTIGGKLGGFYLDSFNTYVKAYTGTYGSSLLLKSLFKMMTTESNVFDHHMLARSRAPQKLDAVNLFGSLKMGTHKLSSFFGKMSNVSSSRQISTSSTAIEKKEKQNIKSFEQSLEEFAIVPKIELEAWRRKTENLISKSIEGTAFTNDDLELPVEKLSRDRLHRYSKVMEFIRTKCYSNKDQSIFFSKSGMFARMFNLEISEHKIMDAVKTVC